ncbi:sulfurtransferase TusA family protein [Rhodomicrobium lacus]|jgi:tRNA 2-thiouridine synthesizing protein A|uniref:sulfurtransferase TusA family protein n=1 Tax=Rhodomicrobium lacus TaxID=2498452 RepID=UPI000F8C4249|nr:sulfurtransferase TusA family protein [Rhodomicrobium lacus]WKW52411.1 sulfurtransferase TusA family protein [Rhodomicrobium lacus]
MTDTITIDTRGLSCPLPVLLAKKHLRAIAGGTLVRILATDPLAPEDFRDFCRVSGCVWIGSREAEDGALEITIRQAKG